MGTLTHSEILWRKIHMAEPRLDAASRQFWFHPELRQLFPGFLRELRSSMRCSMSLMTSALERCRLRSAAGDEVARQEADYLAGHIEEERGHEQWLLDDMAALGLEIRAHAAPSAAIAALAGPQHCWVENAHPVAVLAYLTVLEGNPPLPEQLLDIQRRTALPPEAFRCLLEHAERDPYHLEELNELIDRLPLQPFHSELLGISALQTIDALAELFEHLIESRADVRAPSLTAAGGGEDT